MCVCVCMCVCVIVFFLKKIISVCEQGSHNNKLPLYRFCR